MESIIWGLPGDKESWGQMQPKGNNYFSRMVGSLYFRHIKLEMLSSAPKRKDFEVGKMEGWERILHPNDLQRK